MNTYSQWKRKDDNWSFRGDRLETLQQNIWRKPCYLEVKETAMPFISNLCNRWIIFVCCKPALAEVLCLSEKEWVESVVSELEGSTSPYWGVCFCLRNVWVFWAGLSTAFYFFLLPCFWTAFSIPQCSVLFVLFSLKCWSLKADTGWKPLSSGVSFHFLGGRIQTMSMYSFWNQNVLSSSEVALPLLPQDCCWIG